MTGRALGGLSYMAAHCHAHHAYYDAASMLHTVLAGHTLSHHLGANIYFRTFKFFAVVKQLIKTSLK
jgi:hypothetical protein